MELIKRLSEIQQELKVKKGRENTFGGYFYRNLEDIMEAVKPILNGLVLTFSDEVKEIGGNLYVVATAKLSDGKDEIFTTGYARETMEKKKYDSSQLTGSASTYARKYAANGLFCLDDAKDPDSNEASKEETIDLAKVAKECGWKIEQVLNSFTPPIKSLQDIKDKKACAEYLKSNKVK